MVRRRRRMAQSEPDVTPQLLDAVRALSMPLRSPVDLDPLLERIGEARFVLLGEASHGTHEYYAWRDLLSRRLIEEKGFSFIAVEGDWPDCYRINRYIKGRADSGDSAREVLHHFQRWPTWMWANEEILTLTEWLRDHNNGRPVGPASRAGLEVPLGKRHLPPPVGPASRAGLPAVGFYGLDVYSLWDSLYQVLGYLGKHAPESLPAARRAFQCFEPYGEDVQEYARATRWIDTSCEDEVIALLSELRRTPPPVAQDDPEAQFNAEQNALVVRNAEHYYRTMVQGGPQSWNVRDRHMTETLDRLMRHHGPQAKAIVWAHNTHIGDARYTDMADDGMFNIGQLVRQTHEAEGVVLIGFGSYRGSVIAGDEWDAPMQRMPVPPGRPGSWEDVLQRASAEDQLLLLDEACDDENMLEERGHRAIGVVYHPDYEQYGNYVPTVLPRRYDAFLFLHHTRALSPLHEVQAREDGEVPETYPSGV